MVAIPHDPIWVLEIEGLGFVHASEGPTTWWLTDQPGGAWDNLGRCLPVLGRGFPGAYDVRADFRSGRPSGGGLSFEVIRQQASAQAQMLLDAFATARPIQVGQLQAPLAADAADDTVDLGADAAGLGGQVVFRGREGIWLGVEGDPGVYAACTRQVLGTPLQEHPVGAGYATQVYSSWWPRDARAVRLKVISRHATSYEEAIALQTFPYRSGGHAGLGKLRLRTDGPFAVLRELDLHPAPWRARVSALRGLEGYVTHILFVAEPQPGHDFIRAPYGMTFTDGEPDGDGELLVWWEGALRRLEYLGGAEADGTGPSRWLMDAFSGGARRWGGDALSQNKLANGDYEPLCSQAFVSDQSAPEASRLPGTVGACLYHLLTAPHFGAWPVTSVDAAAFAAFDGELGALARIDRLFVGTREGEKLLKVLERECAIYDACVVPGPDGLMLRRLADSTPSGVAETALVDPVDIRALSEDFGEERIVDRILWSYDRAADGVVTPLVSEDLGLSAAHLGSDRAQEYDGGSISDELQSYYLAFAKLDRYRVALHHAGFEAGAEHVLLPGDPVRLTSLDALVRQDGDELAEGATGSRAVIVQGRYQHDRGVYGYVAARTGLSYDRQRFIGSGALVIGHSSNTLVLRDNEFIDDEAPVGQDLVIDRDGFAAGDATLIVDKEGATKLTGVVVTGASGSNALLCSGLGAYTWAEGDCLKLAAWDDSAQAQRDRWAHTGDTSGVVPSGGLSAPQYESL